MNIKLYVNFTFRELNDCFASLNDNSECRVIVLTGSGKHFTAGNF